MTTPDQSGGKTACFPGVQHFEDVHIDNIKRQSVDDGKIPLPSPGVKLRLYLQRLHCKDHSNHPE